MSKKIFWFDTETTGLDPRRHALIQMAYIVDIDGEVVEEGNLLIRPFPADDIDGEALKVNGRTRQEILQEPFMSPIEGYRKIHDMLCTHVDKYNRADKFYPGGYNVPFDIGFLSEFFHKHDDPYFGSFFNGRILDPRQILALMDYGERVHLGDHKLVTVCAHYGIEFNAHDAMSDIRATRALFGKLWQKISFDKVEQAEVK